MLVRASLGPEAPPTRAEGWIYSSTTDLLIAFCWVPLFVAGAWLAAGTGPAVDARIRWAVAGILVVSFLHQPLTFALVYGDGKRYKQRRRLFLWAPPIAVAVIALAVWQNLWLVIPVAALWNTIHTLQQRYGLSRVYARKAGYGSAFLDRWVLYGWMGAAVLVVAARRGTQALVERAGLGGVNGAGVRLLTDARPVSIALLVPVAAIAVGLAVALVRQERSQEDPSRAKWVYQVSSLVLIASIAINPVAGFVAYVGAHALEYAIVVYMTATSRYGGGRDRTSALGRVATTAPGRVGVLVVVAFGALAFASRFQGRAAEVVLFTVGALHFLYDGFIWKLRKPAVAADFAISPEGSL